MVQYWNTGQMDANFFIGNCPAYEYERIFLFASRILQKNVFIVLSIVDLKNVLSYFLKTNVNVSAP